MIIVRIILLLIALLLTIVTVYGWTVIGAPSIHQVWGCIMFHVGAFVCWFGVWVLRNEDN